MGLKLSEMESSTPLAPLLTRHNLSRLCAQMSDRSGRLLGPAICTMKVLLSRACEIASYEELDNPLQRLDPEFTGTVVKVLENL